MFTLPPWIINTLPLIVNGIFGIIKGKQQAENISRTEGITDNSSAEDVENIINIFSDYKRKVHEKTTEIENILEKELEAYREELRITLEDKSEAIKKYGIRPERLEKEIHRLGRDIHGSIDKEISRKISLDDSECRKIMRMIPGEQKEEKFAAFFRDAIKTALDCACEEFQNILKDFYHETEEDILEVVERVQRKMEQNALDFSTINAENYRMKSLDVQKKVCVTISVCDAIENIMEEGEH
ncbi:MAG: hypothetical protein HFH13_06925 [Dorea sp.]|nr:hypothetical protein [Dorea sp.]